MAFIETIFFGYLKFYTGILTIIGYRKILI